MTEKNNDTPDLAEVLRAAFDFMMQGVNHAMPGKIEAYDPATQLADIKPLIQRSRERLTVWASERVLQP